MRFLTGVLCGMLLLIAATFIVDSWTAQEDPTIAGQTPVALSDRIVNWDVARNRLHRSFESIRERVHELTR
jgi:hypothetical protein